MSVGRRSYEARDEARVNKVAKGAESLTSQIFNTLMPSYCAPITGGCAEMYVMGHLRSHPSPGERGGHFRRAP